MLKNKWIARGGLVLALLILTVASVQAEEIAYNTGNRRDPFVPLSAEDGAFLNSSSAGVRLEGIIYDPGRRSMVILSGKAYQAGDAVGEAKVVTILKDHVVISVGGEEKILWIREAEKT